MSAPEWTTLVQRAELERAAAKQAEAFAEEAARGERARAEDQAWKIGAALRVTRDPRTRKALKRERAALLAPKPAAKSADELLAEADELLRASRAKRAGKPADVATGTRKCAACGQANTPSAERCAKCQAKMPDDDDDGDAPGTTSQRRARGIEAFVRGVVALTSRTVIEGPR